MKKVAKEFRTEKIKYELDCEDILQQKTDLEQNFKQLGIKGIS